MKISNFKEIKATLAGCIPLAIATIWFYNHMDVLKTIPLKEFAAPGLCFIVGILLWFAPDKVIDLLIGIAEKEIKKDSSDNKIK